LPALCKGLIEKNRVTALTKSEDCPVTFPDIPRLFVTQETTISQPEHQTGAKTQPVCLYRAIEKIARQQTPWNTQKKTSAHNYPNIEPTQTNIRLCHNLKNKPTQNTANCPKPKKLLR
jgi:hypothetical protein